ncbi:positive regulator of sigma E activity [Alkalihalobacillus xiaoxiensis]|uniref:Positive regulator of sigma E activity n=1 Tax=Shouchella xiaoxiensis TaxID=766895 RepID=A0ABS2SNE4_9BACI|nr:DUF3953 domain-containing protein [Shouchella xiaoxiensis]MBM7837037.1 positive regulator of sigma E activity [Shouchella xiaoxiensis]
MKLVRLILGIIVVSLSSYALLTGVTEALIPYVLFFLGAMLFVSGMIEFRKKSKTMAILLFFVTGFNFIVLFTILLS